MTTLLTICDANEPKMAWKASRSLSLTQTCQEETPYSTQVKPRVPIA